MKKLLLLIASAGLLLSGCSNDYTPSANATGEDIFKGACMECHEAIEGKENIFYEIAGDKRNVDFFADKISSGSLIMPKFPNISGEDLKAVSQYALELSIDK